MLADRGQVQEALADTDLVGRPVSELEIDEESEVLIVDQLRQEPHALVAAWRTCRGLVDVLGRWPVLVPIDWELYHEPTPDELARLVARVEHLDPWPRLGWSEDETLEAAQVDDPAALQELPFPTTDSAYARWRYDRILRERATDPTGQPSTLPHRTRAIRSWPKETQLVLLPTDVPWLAPAWLSYFPALSWPDEFVAACRQWHLRWGAELVACWSTVVEFFIQRPPAPGDDAWQVARQVRSWAGSVNRSTLDLALTISQDGAWYLHDRP